MTAKAATGVGSSILVNDYINLQIDLSTASNANLTIKVQGSYMPPDSPPTFSSAASATNRWFYVATYDLNDPSAVITGTTGYSFAGADGVKGILVNVDGLTWLNMEITARAAGSATATLLAYNNQ